MSEQNYAGFWIRVGATLIDTIFLLVIILPLLTLIYGTDYWASEPFVYGIWDVLLQYIFPAAAVIVFWIYRSATPGKMILKLTIVDAATGGKPTTGQFIGRYLAYYIINTDASCNLNNRRKDRSISPSCLRFVAGFTSQLESPHWPLFFVSSQLIHTFLILAGPYFSNLDPARCIYAD